MSTLTLPFGDDADRLAIRENLDQSLLVEASAGTGKTYELVQRAVNLIASGRAQIDRLVIVTFTRKAAGELQLRLRAALDEARGAAADPAPREYLDQALARLEEAHIGTIHGFCARILRERPVEARVDPDFVELSEGEAAVLHDEVFRRWLQEHLSALPLAVERALRRDAEYGQFDQTPIERLAAASRALLDWRDHPQPWRRDSVDLAPAMRELVAEIAALADQLRAADDEADPLRVSLRAVLDFDDWWATSFAAPGATMDVAAVENQLLVLGRALNKAGKASYGAYASGVRRHDVEQARDALKRALRTFRDETEADLAAELHDALREVAARYDAAKAQAGQLDYLDLLLKVRDMLVGDDDVRAFLQERFTHLLVDEFQDTDVLQIEILLLLAADDPAETAWRRARPRPGKLFLVGDPKQSIYRFRRADVVLYQEVRGLLAGHGVGMVHLSRSFRANAALQAAVNLAFEPELTADARTGQAGYVPLIGGPPPPDDQPALVALPIPSLHTGPKPTRRAAEESQPDAVAAYSEWLCRDSGWTVRRPDGTRRPVEVSDVGVLFNRLKSGDKDRSQAYADALDARRLPHVLVGSWSFRDRPEIEALLAVLTAIEWPEDDLSVYAALRGPFIALSDETLLRYRARQGRLHPFAPVPDDLPDELRPVADALALLRRLCESRNDVPLPETVFRVLDETRAHVGLALRPAGRRALANVQRVADIARGFEARGGLSFRGFVEAVEVEAARARGHEGPVDEPATPGVRLMTVFSAKGLEFPVVILADVTASASWSPGRHVDAGRGLAALKLVGCAPWELRDNMGLERARDHAEAVRLAYVAATRARDLLVVNTVGLGMGTFFNPERDARSWVHPLEKVLYPPPFARSHPAPGLPRVGDSSCLSQPPERRTIQPGLHTPHPGGPPVVWWDPATLGLDAPTPYGLRQEHYLAEDPDGVRDAAGRTEYAAWRRRVAEALDRGNVASIVPLAASEADHDPPDYEGFVDEVVLPIRAGRPSGMRFGALVHDILQDVALDADRTAVRDAAKMHGRTLQATGDEVEAAAEAVSAALTCDLLARARRAEVCHREWPILFATDDGETLDGALDLAFREDAGWVVVDFKTDQDPKTRLEQYRRQMAWYLHALVRTTGVPASGYLLRV